MKPWLCNFLGWKALWINNGVSGLLWGLQCDTFDKLQYSWRWRRNPSLVKKQLCGENLAAPKAGSHINEANRRQRVGVLSCPSLCSAYRRRHRCPSLPRPSSSSSWQLWCCAPARCLHCFGHLLFQQRPLVQNKAVKLESFVESKTQSHSFKLYKLLESNLYSLLKCLLVWLKLFMIRK